MSIKSIALAGLLATAWGTGAFALDQTAIDNIVSQLSGQGYTHIHIKAGPNGARVEAEGPNGTQKLRFDAAGNAVAQGTGSSSGSSGSDSSRDRSGAGRDDFNDDHGGTSNRNGGASREREHAQEQEQEHERERDHGGDDHGSDHGGDSGNDD